MSKILKSLLLCVTFLFIAQARAAISPLAVAIFPPVEFPPEDFSVTGLRVSAILGEHRNVYGIDIGGIGNVTTQSFSGVAVSGIFNRNFGPVTIIGLQAAGATNINTQKTSVVGLQVSMVNSNTAETQIIGLQLGPAANLSAHTKIYGFQIGLYNSAYEVYGFQIGLLNFVETMHGIQIGLLNFQQKGTFSVCPIINAGF